MECKWNTSDMWSPVETSLQSLTVGVPNIILEIKVDRIITRYSERLCGNDDRPCLELESVDFIIFGTTKDIRMMVRIMSVELMEMHCWKILEGRCYQIDRFFVNEGGQGVHDSMHLVLGQHSTIIPSVNNRIPDRCFILNSVDEINWWGYPSNSKLIDVCGLLRSFYPSSKYKSRGIYSMSLVMELEDKRKKFIIRCVLMGDAFEMALPFLNDVNHCSGVFVVVKYARITQKFERGIELSAVQGTTRVYVNPDFPEVAAMKEKVLPS